MDSELSEATESLEATARVLNQLTDFLHDWADHQATSTRGSSRSSSTSAGRHRRHGRRHFT